MLTITEDATILFFLVSNYGRDDHIIISGLQLQKRRPFFHKENHFVNKVKQTLIFLIKKPLHVKKIMSLNFAVCHLPLLHTTNL